MSCGDVQVRPQRGHRTGWARSLHKSAFCRRITESSISKHVLQPIPLQYHNIQYVPMVLTINQEFRGRRGDCLEFPWKCLCTLQNPMKEKFHPDLDEQAMRVTKKGKELSGSTKGNTWIKYIISVNPANFLLIFFSVKHTFNIRLTSI